MNFDQKAIATIEAAPNFFEKHQIWLQNVKEEYQEKLKNFSLRALMVLALISFGQQEVDHLGKDNAYDFKKYLMIGFKQKASGLDNISLQNIEENDESSV